MKLRCPYCRAVYDPADLPSPCCPQCGKVMLIPPSVKLRAGLPVEPRPPRDRQAQAPIPPRRRIVLTVGQRLLTRTRVVLWLGFGVILFITFVSKQHIQKPDPEQIRRLAVMEVTTLRTALENFQHDCGRYPSDREHLIALISNPGIPRWHGPYITLLKPDPWGHPFGYESATNATAVFSIGPDGLRATADDIVAVCRPTAPRSAAP